ncbi:MAG: hypothetical protein J4215_02820 [Candidatus Diapherotrites archaeon]|uniref:Uncharacterized protein n=1 Tax=Candidatus Iainarchaeum sp. TaxID=3101447 RepID=A0A8T4L7J3_9ARCH|nr:hypothetical protein [Candidatus Diapherotrites archaeon]
MKYMADVRRRFGNRSGFTLSDLRVFLQQKKIPPAYLYQLVHHLTARGELHRISKSVYSFSEELNVVGEAFHPSYHGLQDALSLHGLWEQETVPVILTPRKVRTGIRTFLGQNYLVRRISRKMFFGFRSIKCGNLWLTVSDIEKTLIDLAYFRQPLEKDALAEIKARLDGTKLRKYLNQCDSKTRQRVEKWLQTGAKNKSG